ncbi:MAG: hypothetical protein ACOVK9_04380 [Bacteroidia bacterium]
MKHTFTLALAIVLSTVIYAQWAGPTSGILSTTNRVHLNYTASLGAFNPSAPPPPPSYFFALNFIDGANTEPSLRVNDNNGQVEIGKTLRLINGATLFMTRSNNTNVLQVDDIGRMRLTTDGFANSSRGFFVNNGSVDFFSITQDGMVFKDQNQDLFKVNTDGYAFARKMTVTLSNPFPDYVFEKEYKLMPLADLSTFINKHKHLPNMPSAHQVANNNNQVELGDMQTKLLEKVEELTLYILQQQAQIDALKRILAEQK